MKKYRRICGKRSKSGFHFSHNGYFGIRASLAHKRHYRVFVHIALALYAKFSKLESSVLYLKAAYIIPVAAAGAIIIIP
jgi:hypothetical protein